MIDGLDARLDRLAARGHVMTYGELVGDLELTGPGRIARLTTALEELMEIDTQAQAPLRAALVVGRSSGGLPARGFFEKALALGHDTSDPAAFHRTHMDACFARARKAD